MTSAAIEPGGRWPEDPGQLQLAELLGALSHALDATAGHALRVTLNGSEIGRLLGLPDPELHDLYYTLMLTDLG